MNNESLHREIIIEVAKADELIDQLQSTPIAFTKENANYATLGDLHRLNNLLSEIVEIFVNDKEKAQ